jgi:DNA-binding LacI/PurR family transcriptional regulator
MADRPYEALRRPTIKDVARVAGVSTALVSIVFRHAPGASEQTRERIFRIAEEIGYKPDAHARLLRRARARLLGVTFLVQSAFHGDLLLSIYAAAERVGYEVTLNGWTSKRSEETAIQALLGFRCDALILMGPQVPEPLLSELNERLPVVVISRRLMAPVADCVRTDDAVGMQLAVEHLVSLGHRNIAHIDGGENVKGLDRLRGYLEAMKSVGLGDRIRVIPGGETVEAGAAAGQTLLNEPGADTAIVAFDDDCAWGLIATLQAGGVSVPGDLSVVGFDGGALSRLVPITGLTTVRQDADALAALSVNQAVARLENVANLQWETVLAPTLIVRNTTAAIEPK